MILMVCKQIYVSLNTPDAIALLDKLAYSTAENAQIFLVFIYFRNYINQKANFNITGIEPYHAHELC